MSQTQTLTGKAGNVTVGGTVIPITKWTSKLNVDYADSTDSGSYDAASQNQWKSQLPSGTQLEITIEGNYDKATTAANISTLLKNSANGPFACVLKLDAATTYASGNFDFNDVEVNLSVPGATIVTFSTNGKSNGLVTLSG